MNPRERCLARQEDGKRCPRRIFDNDLFGLCVHHANAIARKLAPEIQARHIRELDEARRHGLTRREMEKKREERGEYIRADLAKAQSQVYYIRIGDYIKIGYTTAMDARLSGLRVSKSDVLATEPGGRDLERQRHLQFKHLRIGQRENFRPAPDLIAHTEQIRETHGEPKITTVVRLNRVAAFVRDEIRKSQASYRYSQDTHTHPAKPVDTAGTIQA